MDFLEFDSAGNKYTSSTIYQKLPVMLRKEIIKIVGNNYPSLNDIFDNYSQVIRTLEIIKPKYNSQVKHEYSKDKILKWYLLCKISGLILIILVTVVISAKPMHKKLIIIKLFQNLKLDFSSV